LNTGGGGRGS